MIVERKCLNCYKLFSPTPNRPRHVYCCKYCQKLAANRRWYEANRERVCTQHKDYRNTNKDRIKVYYKEWWRKHRVRVNAAKEKLSKV